MKQIIINGNMHFYNSEYDREIAEVKEEFNCSTTMACIVLGLRQDDINPEFINQCYSLNWI